MVIKLCECGCGQPVKPSNRYLNGHYFKGKKFSLEHKQKICEGNLGKKISQETRQKMSESAKRKKLSEAHKRSIGQANTGHKHTEETKQKMRDYIFTAEHRQNIGKTRLGRKHTAEAKQKMSKALKGRKLTAEWRQRTSEAMKLCWQDPEYITKIIKAHSIKPTKPEVALQAMLDKHCPEFQYNGDYGLGITLAGMIPDYVNINGKKEVIELFGDYWHSAKLIKNKWKSTELGKTMAYNALGYKCLIIWEHELKDEQAVIEKIKKWTIKT